MTSYEAFLKGTDQKERFNFAKGDVEERRGALQKFAANGRERISPQKRNGKGTFGGGRVDFPSS